MDVLSDALRAVRLEGALFLNGELHAPWAVTVPKGADIARMVKPGAQRMAICHLLLEGNCWVQMAGQAPLNLAAGDVVTLPHGDTHVLGSTLQHASIDIGHVVRPRMPELTPVRYGGDGERTVVVCGWLAYEGDLPNPIVPHLPRIFSTRLRTRPAGTRWRMVVAAGMLRNQQGTLARVASDVGYESEAAFNRAFKREYGVPPGSWRQGAHALPSAA